VKKMSAGGSSSNSNKLSGSSDDDLSIFMQVWPPKQCFKSQSVIFSTNLVHKSEKNYFGHIGRVLYPCVSTDGSVENLTTYFV
jgi:hypothetical protein